MSETVTAAGGAADNAAIVPEIFFSPLCFNCNLTKTFLTRAGVEFRARNVNDPGVLDELNARGFTGIPVTFVGEDAVVGFNPERLSELLDLQGVRPVTDALTEGVVDRMTRMIDAWIRAVRDVPLGVFGHPGGDLWYTVANALDPHLEEAMSALETGVFEPVLPLEKPPFDRASALALLEARKERFAEWVAALAPGDLERECDGHLGRVHISRALEVVLGRSAFHLERLYGMLREAGVEPDSPFDEAELAQLADFGRMAGPDQ
jgi:glutaredoxin-like protein NrdH